MSDFNMDSHKLMYHPERVSRWLKGELVYPICAELSLSSFCNHRCSFCALDYTDYPALFMDRDIIENTIKQMAENGLKAIVFSGEGEPFVHHDAPEIIVFANAIGVDIGISSNGVLFTADKIDRCLGSITWIRFSVAAAKSNTYDSIHRCKSGDLKKAIDNMVYCAERKRSKAMNTTLGIQMLLINENKDQVVELCKLAKAIGMDYFTVKPYSKNPNSINDKIMLYDDRILFELKKELQSFATEEFKVIFRDNAMNRLYEERCYSHCYSYNFFIHISTKGEITPCIAFINNADYSFGNINEKSFIDIWGNKSKTENKIHQHGVVNCREICRSDEINRYLYRLRNPQEHDNFI